MSFVGIACLINLIVFIVGVFSHQYARDLDYQDYVMLDSQSELDRLWHANALDQKGVGHHCRGHSTPAAGKDGREYDDIEYPEEVITWRKRSPVSPYVSIGALNNLPQFFDQLRESFENLQKQKEREAQQAQMQTVEADRSFRPPATAAVLHAFRNYRPLRKTRSFQPSVVQG